jgi:cell shape-determining protein MreC
MIFESDNSDKKLRKQINSWLLYTVIVIIVLSLLFGGFSYITKVFNANNAIVNYERFFDYKREYEVRVSQIQTLKQQLVDFADDKNERVRVNQELAAVRMSCRHLAGTYNLDSRKITREYFKSDTLPFELDAGACEK